MKLKLFALLFPALVSAANCPPEVAEKTVTSKFYGPDGRLQRTKVEQGCWLRFRDGALLEELRPLESAAPVYARFVQADGRVFVPPGQNAEYRESGRQAPPCLMIGKPEQPFEPPATLNGYETEVPPYWISLSKSGPRQLGGRAYYSRELRLMLRSEVRFPGHDGSSVLRKEEFHSIRVAEPDDTPYPASLRKADSPLACAACPAADR